MGLPFLSSFPHGPQTLKAGTEGDRAASLSEAHTRHL